MLKRWVDIIAHLFRTYPGSIVMIAILLGSLSLHKLILWRLENYSSKHRYGFLSVRHSPKSSVTIIQEPEMVENRKFPKCPQLEF